MESDERYERLLRGHIDGVDEHVMRLAADPEPLARTWAVALRAAAAAAVPARGAPSIPDDSPSSMEQARVRQLAHLHRARHAFVTFEVDREDSLNAARKLERGEGVTASLALEEHLAALDRGRSTALDHDDLRGRARAAGDAATVIGLAIAQAVEAELVGDPLAALAAARRASRMARTEAMPQQEYFANLVLARCRRLVGHPHLAARILRSLLEIASAQWRPWLAWELLLSGAVEIAERLVLELPDGTAAGLATSAAIRLLDAAKNGDARDFAIASESLMVSGRTSRRLGVDASALIGALDGRRPGEADSSGVRAWATGEQPTPPRGLHGLAAAMAGPDEMNGALVFVAADSNGGRRVMMPGPNLLVPEFHPVGQSQRQQGRMDTMVAVLALAGAEGLGTRALFRRVYGFEFDPDIHRGALRKLLARVDGWLGEQGTVHGDGARELDPDESRHHLELHAAILVADPRCAPPVDVRVLGVLATRGSTSARDAAKRLQIPLRTAQAALQNLMEEGACLRVRSGNRVAYQIEDTTFSEPTRH